MFTWKTPGWLGYKDTHTAISQGQDTLYTMQDNIQENRKPWKTSGWATKIHTQLLAKDKIRYTVIMIVIEVCVGTWGFKMLVVCLFRC